jgi:hypothetical protein
VINLPDKTALYHFLFTISGTRHVASRTESVDPGFHF